MHWRSGNAAPTCSAISNISFMGCAWTFDPLTAGNRLGEGGPNGDSDLDQDE